MTSCSRVLRVVRTYVVQWLVLVTLALGFTGARRVIGIDDAMSWHLFGQLVLFAALACVLGAIYRRPLPDGRGRSAEEV
jgi:hypothetical protein